MRQVTVIAPPGGSSWTGGTVGVSPGIADWLSDFEVFVVFLDIIYIVLVRLLVHRIKIGAGIFSLGG